MKCFPRYIRIKIFSLSRKLLIEYWKAISVQIPKYELQNENIKNTTFIVNRDDLLQLLPKNGVVAELGVGNGEFSEKILRVCNPTKLHLIDIWDTQRYDQLKRSSVEISLEKKLIMDK